MFVSFFNNLIKPVFNIVQNIASLVQQLSQVASDYTGVPQTTTPPQTPAAQLDPGTTITPEERERLRRQRAEAARQRKLARMEADFERSIEAAGEQPLRYPAGYLSIPADADIRWIGDPECERLMRLLTESGELVDMALGITQSPKAALDLLLAQRPSCKEIQPALSNKPSPKYAEHYVSASDIHYPQAGEGSVYGPAFDPGVGVAFGATLTVANVFRNMSPEDWHNLSSTLEQALLQGSSGSLSARVGAIAAASLGDPSSQIFESRSVSELKNRVETLAEHLAKIMGDDVAGYSPTGPNPNRDPDAGWCETIKRTIEAIDNLSLSPNQFNRDFEETGIGWDTWDEIKNALKDLKKEGYCDDYWGDFTGGSLAGG